MRRIDTGSAVAGPSAARGRCAPSANSASLGRRHFQPTRVKQDRRAISRIPGRRDGASVAPVLVGRTVGEGFVVRADEAIADKLVTAVGSRRGPGAADRLCEVCVEVLAVDAAAISLVFDGVDTGTLGVSDERATVYDEVQFTVGEGPCLDAVEHGRAVMVDDLADAAHPRWSVYPSAMLTHDIHGVFAMPVVAAGEYVGALELFRARPGPLTELESAGMMVAAELAQMPLLDVLAVDLDNAVNDPDSDAWSELNALSRVEVSQATGMMVAQLGVEPVQALARLRAHAFAVDRNISDVARDVLDRRLRLEPG